MRFPRKGIIQRFVAASGELIKGNIPIITTGSLHQAIITMKTILISAQLLFLPFLIPAQSPMQFDIFTCQAPAGYVLKDNKEKLFFEKIEGSAYCQLYLWKATTGESDPEKDFARDWNNFAVTPYQVSAPETKEMNSADGWTVTNGAARGTYKNIQFVISISTYSKGAVTYAIVSVLNDRKYLADVDQFTATVDPDLKKFKPGSSLAKPVVNQPGQLMNMAKPTTNFDDGWMARAQTSYVQLQKSNTEIRLHYVDAALDDAKSNMIDAPEYYWKHYIEPYFSVRQPEKWSGVQYPVIYFMQGNATNKQTGASCFVAIKIVYNGGARPIVVISPDQSSYQRQFPHPNDLDRMLSYNKFAVTAKDIIGTWNGGGGGGLEYYNAYTGNYMSSHTLSTTDEFSFNSNGTYSSMYRSANINGGNAQFGGQDFKGKFSCTDWQLSASNRYRGATTNFNAQLIAVKGGYLLYLQDKANSSMQYTLYRTK